MVRFYFMIYQLLNENIRQKFYHSHLTLLTQSHTAFLCNQSRVFSQIMMLFVLYCSFLCNVLEASIFNKILRYCRPKIKLFWKKNYRIIKRWGQCPQTFKTALPILPLHLQIPDYAPVAVAYLVNRLDKATYFAISSF